MVSKLLGLIFGLSALVMLLIALVFTINTTLLVSSSSTANGVIVNGGDSSGGRKVRGLIEFQAADGKTYQFYSAVASNPPEFQTGQAVKVFYKPSDPAGSAQVDSLISLWFWSLLFGFLGFTFAIVGGVSLFIWLSGQNKKKWLQQNGRRISAVITDVKINKAVHNMGKSPYYVLARPREITDGLSQSFRSFNIWNLPATATPGSDINVLVDPRNPNRYYVELEEVKRDAVAKR